MPSWLSAEAVERIRVRALGDGQQDATGSWPSSDDWLRILASAVWAESPGPRMAKALSKAEQLALVASDWNLCTVEIDGEDTNIYRLRDEFRALLRELEAK